MIIDEQVREHTLKVVMDFQTLIAQKRMQEWIELWHDDGILEFPFAPRRPATGLPGKAAMLAQIPTSMGRVEIDEIRYFKVHPLLNPTCVMVGAGTSARMITTGRPYNQTYVLYLETLDGKISKQRLSRKSSRYRSGARRSHP